MATVKHKFLTQLAKFILRHPKLIAASSILLAFISLFLAFNFLVFDNDQDNLISNKLAYHQRYKNYLSQFGDSEYLFVVFEVPKGSEKKVKKALVSLVDKIKDQNNLFEEISFKADFSVFNNRGLLLLPAKDFNELVTKLGKWGQDISTVSTINSYTQLFNFAAKKLKQVPSAAGKNKKDLELSFGLFKKIIEGIDKPHEIAKLSTEDFFQPVIGKKYYRDPDGFFFSENGKLLFLKVMPTRWMMLQSV